MNVFPRSPALMFRCICSVLFHYEFWRGFGCEKHLVDLIQLDNSCPSPLLSVARTFVSLIDKSRLLESK